jgi:branched-chain amino acid transport system ATP-binding protein
VIDRAYRFELNGSRLEPGAPQLQVDGVDLWFGGVRALVDVSLEVAQGDIHAIIGPNGAGKTSLLNCDQRVVPARRTARSATAATRRGLARADRLEAAPDRPLGVARSFQNIELFRHMTVLENLMLGRHVHLDHRCCRPAVVRAGARQEIAHRELVEEIIDLLEIQSYRHQPVGALAYGIQKRVELGRALAMQPGLLLLDEPMAGMNSEEKEDMARYVLDVNELAG